MRKFIRNTKTGLFLSQDGRWTRDVEKAFEIYCDELLRRTYREYHLPFCELYYCFAKKPSNLDFAFPLSKLPWLKPALRRQTSH